MSPVLVTVTPQWLHAVPGTERMIHIDLTTVVCAAALCQRAAKPGKEQFIATGASPLGVSRQRKAGPSPGTYL